MTTDPLDIGDVVAAVGRQPWGGMPPGTTIGQVHLVPDTPPNTPTTAGRQPIHGPHACASFRTYDDWRNEHVANNHARSEAAQVPRTASDQRPTASRHKTVMRPSVPKGH
jgi:catechol-2,3-dioxygenase